MSEVAEERWAGKPQGSARKGSNPFGADADAYMCVQEHVHVSAEVEGRKDGRKGRKKAPTTRTRARVAWARAARETSEARQPVGPSWCEVTDRAKERKQL